MNWKLFGGLFLRYYLAPITMYLAMKFGGMTFEEIHAAASGKLMLITGGGRWAYQFSEAFFFVPALIASLLPAGFSLLVIPFTALIDKDLLILMIYVFCIMVRAPGATPQWGRRLKPIPFWFAIVFLGVGTAWGQSYLVDQATFFGAKYAGTMHLNGKVIEETRIELGLWQREVNFVGETIYANVDFPAGTLASTAEAVEKIAGRRPTGSCTFDNSGERPGYAFRKSSDGKALVMSLANSPAYDPMCKSVSITFHDFDTVTANFPDGLTLKLSRLPNPSWSIADQQKRLFKAMLSNPDLATAG